jgi:hypothetical protein
VINPEMLFPNWIQKASCQLKINPDTRVGVIYEPAFSNVEPADHLFWCMMLINESFHALCEKGMFVVECAVVPNNTQLMKGVGFTLN